MKKNIFFLLHSITLLLSKLSSYAVAQSSESTPPPTKDNIKVENGELLVEGIGKEFNLQKEDILNVNDFINASDPNKSIHSLPVIPVVPLYPGY